MNTTSDQPPTTKELIKTNIVEMVTSAWAENQLATLVARVGANLSKEFDLKKDLDGLKLADFIKKELSDKLKFINSPKDEMIKALIPIDADVNEDVNTHFRNFYNYVKVVESNKPVEVSYKRINIHRSVWKAFSSQLNPCQFRHLKLEPNVHFQDTDNAGKLEGYYLVDSSFINPPDKGSKSSRDEAIQNNILKWAENNDISSDKILVKTSANVISRQQKSVLSVLVEALDSSDYARISIPLDIVIKLQNKSL